MTEEVKYLSLKEAREKDKIAEFIEQNSQELAEDEEFVRLLERIERDQKARISGYIKP